MFQYKYNPQNVPPEELKQTFTAREAILSSLLSDIKKEVKSKSNQHFLVIGPRGIGKTNLLRMIYLNIKCEPEFTTTYIPLQFAEEEYSIGTVRELFEKTIVVLNEEIISKEVVVFLESITEETNDDTAAEKSVEFLKNFCRKEKKKIVLFVDNLDLILGDQFKDNIEIKRLRDVLMNENFLILVGAAPTYFDEVSNYDRPFYNFFRTVNLDELTVEQMEELIKRRAAFDENKSLLDKLPEYRPKLKALHHLAGGNPRLILMLYQLLIMSNFTKVKDYLNGLLDDLTPYYQSKLRSLSAQQRKIVDSIARLNRAVSPTEIARNARLDVNVVSTNLKRLRDWGYVKSAKQERRKATYYIISERLFRIWHQMRHSPGLRRRIQFLVEFIQIWYSIEEIKTVSRSLIKNYEDFVSRQKIIEAKGVIEHLDYITAANLEPEFKQALSHKVVEMNIDIGDLERAENRIIELIKECQETGNKEELAYCYFELSEIKVKKRDFQEAIELYDKTVEIKPNFFQAWGNRGSALIDLGQNEEAIKNFEKSLKINPEQSRAWYGRGLAFYNLKRYKEAIESFDNSLKFNNNQYITWYLRGKAFANLGHYDKAIQSYDKGLKLKNNDPNIWYYRGVELLGLNKIDDSTKSFLNALKFTRDEFGKVAIYLVISAIKIFEENYGEAKKTFKSVLEYLPKIKDKSYLEKIDSALIDFFRLITSEQQKNIVKEILQLMLDNEEIKYKVALLEPFNIAIQYWEKNRNPEVLDRLNPEIREIVEQIIKESDAKKKINPNR